MSSHATSIFRAFCLLGTTGLLCSANAATVTYTGPSMGTWSTPGFWSNGVVPGAGDNVKIINNGPSDGFVNGNVAISQPGLSSLEIDGRAGAWAILTTSKNLTVAGEAYLGVSGLGAIEQKGGNMQYGGLALGWSGSNSYGYYTLAKGNVSAGNLFVGNFGFGTFNHIKGNVTVSNAFVVGNESALDSVYSLHNGNLSVGSVSYIGNNGDGFFEQAKGTANFAALTVGQGTGVTGSIKQYGGTIRSTSAIIGGSGAGYFEQYNGSHTVTGNLTLGGSTGGGGVYTLQNGSLNVGGRITVGDQSEGEGLFFHVGGNVTAGQGVSVGAGEYQLKNTTLTTKGLSVAGGSYFTTEGTKSTIRTTGNIEFASSANITTRDATLSVSKGSSISISAIQSDEGASFSALSGAESWNAITLDKNVSLTLSGSTGADAIYVDTFNIGSKKPLLVESIVTGNGVNIYYNASLKSNKYLKGDTYDLINGGQLIPVFSSTSGSSGLIKTGAGSITISTGGSGTIGTVVTGTLSVGQGGPITISNSDTLLSGEFTFDFNGNAGSFDLVQFGIGDTLTFENGFAFQLVDFSGFTLTRGVDGYIISGGTWDQIETPGESSGTLAASAFSNSAPSTVPEPTTALLALLGGASLLARRRSRR